MKKRILSLCLCVALITGCFPVTGSAASNGAYTFIGGERPLVVVAGMDFTGLRMDVGTENERPAIEPITAKGIIKTLFAAGAAAIKARALMLWLTKASTTSAVFLETLPVTTRGHRFIMLVPMSTPTL